MTATQNAGTATATLAAARGEEKPMEMKLALIQVAQTYALLSIAESLIDLSEALEAITSRGLRR